jgi:high affinity Mn2+ porin
MLAVGGMGDLAFAQGRGSGGAPAPSPPQSEASAPAPPAQPVDEASSDIWVVQAQSTFVDQGTLRFRSPYVGPNSLNPGTRGRETFDATLFGGVKPWKGAEIWLDPELDQGFGLSNTLGIAGFPSGEAYKVGKQKPYIRVQRLFLRQTFDLGGEAEKLDGDQNLFAATHTANRLVLWAGKMSVGDVFDTNKYAHDPRGDFFNWSIIDAGSFDYAADAWGYTYGLAGEWYQGPWTLRTGLYDMSKVPNGEAPDDTFTQFQMIVEGERRFQLFGQPGKLKLTGFDSRARMGDFADAIRLAEATGGAPDVLLVRAYRSHAGVSFNLEQQVTDDLGVFARGGWADGHQQSYEFTDIDRTLSAGLSLAGKRWGRPDDVIGLAGVENEISKDFKAYLSDGGLGILIGDGQLTSSGPEKILETYYNVAAAKFAHVTFDYQFVDNPAYNRQRGPVSILAIRLHLQTDSLLHP